MTQNTTIRRLLVVGIVLSTALVASTARAAKIRVTADHSTGSSRLVLTYTQPVVHVIQSSRTRLTVRFAEPVVVEPTEMRFERNRILERYKLKDDVTLVLYLGPDFDRYESFELRNPVRLILDLQGSQKRRGSKRSRDTIDVPKTILVIDPGHGGVEQGAVGPTGLEEKEVTLLLAQELKQVLQLRDASISVVLTRDENRLVGLDERTGVANHNRADLFLSIHLNASPRLEAAGAETYYLSTEATDAEARALAELENRSPGSNRPAETDKLGLVLWDLAQNQHLAESAALAEAVQRHLNQLTGTRNRGVRQAPFRVLEGATMPAILVEVGFISNPEEEARFKTSAYRARVVGALAQAVRDFLINLERFAAPPVEHPMDLP